MGQSFYGKPPANIWGDMLQVSNGNQGIDSNLRNVSDGDGENSPLQLSNTKVRVKPGSNGQVFEVVNAAGTVLFSVNTSTNVITAASGVSFSGDGSLLTGVTPAGVGGTSAVDNLELTADNDSNGTGDIIFKIGTVEVLRIPQTYAASLPTGIAGNYILKTVADNWAAPLPAYIMDGVDDYVSIPDNANLNFGIGDFTIEWYGKFGNNQTIEINKAAGGGYGIRDNGGYIIWVSANGTGASSYRSITDISSLQSDYHHFVIVFTFGVKTESYIDGVLVNTDTVNIISNNSDSTGDLKLGSIFSVYDDYSYVFLRLYNRALIAAEVTEHWNNGEPEKYQIPFSDSGASQNNLGTNENLSGNTGIVSGTGSSGVAADNWNLYGTAGTSVGSKDGSDYQVITVTSGNFLLRNYNGSDFLNLYYGKKYRLFYNAPSNTTGNNLQVAIKSTGSVTRSLDWTPITGSGYIDFTATGTSSDGLVTFRLDSNGTGAITVSQAKITQIGNVLDLKAENAGAMGWLDASGNGLHAVTSGSPIAPQKLRDYKSGISTTAVEFVNSQKAETLLKGIIVTTASGLPTTISLGTTTLANEILSAQAFTTGDFIAIDKYSASERSLFAKCDAGTVNITMIYEEVA